MTYKELIYLERMLFIKIQIKFHKRHRPSRLSEFFFMINNNIVYSLVRDGLF